MFGIVVLDNLCKVKIFTTSTFYIFRVLMRTRNHEKIVIEVEMKDSSSSKFKFLL